MNGAAIILKQNRLMRNFRTGKCNHSGDRYDIRRCCK